MNTQVDKEHYRASIIRLHEIFEDMSDTATAVSTWRCPYKNVRDRCTAKFGCRNQLHMEVPDELAVCTGSDDLDYRGAWEV